MEMRSIFGSFLLLIAIFCSAVTVFGQETTGSIEGFVRDTTGAVVPNVTITISTAKENNTGGSTTGIGTGFKRTVNTNESGFFRVLQVPPGTYSVVSSATSGFGEVKFENVNVAIGQNTQLTIVASPGGEVTTVDVSVSDSPPVDTTNSAIQTTVSAQRIELIPKGTGITSVLRTVPGTRPESRSAGFLLTVHRVEKMFS